MQLLLVIILLALIFDFINGFHDAANSIATVVSTKVLSPFQAVLWAAVFNFSAFWVFDMSVGNTVAKTVDNNFIDLYVILAGLIAATIWNLLTWWFGIPSSSSHTLIGGFAGAAIAHAGFSVIESTEILKVILFIFLAPLIGGIIAVLIALITVSRKIFLKMSLIALLSAVTYFLMQYMIKYQDMKPVMLYILSITLGIFILTYIWYYFIQGKKQTAARETEMYKKLQLVSSAAFSLGHGGADSQKVMGIICAACMVFGNLYREGKIKGDYPDYLKVTEIIQIEYKDSDGKLKKEKPHPEGKKNLLVYTKGDKIFDSSNDELIFEKKKLNTNYAHAAIFEDFVDTDKLKEGYKIKTKVHSDSMPFWIAISCYLAIGLGTLLGGWRIVKTMGTKITKVTPLEGVCAETSGALTLFTVSQLGIPVSTTHTITGAIIGVGITKRASAVRWGITVNLLWAWILTIPVSGLLGGIIYFVVSSLN
ncbi:MAG: anion permease [Bacteroidota bacterium]|jgi:PiT family inorganic phosphate transporter